MERLLLYRYKYNIAILLHNVDAKFMNEHEQGYVYRLSVMYHSSLLQYDVIVRSRYTRESTAV